MPPASEQIHRAGHPRLWVAGLVLAALVVGWLLLIRGPDPAVLRPGRPATGTAGSVTTREDAAATLLARLTSRLTHGTERQTVALAAPGDPAAARELAAIYANVRRLGITGLRMRYVDEDDARTRLRQHRPGTTGWVGDVELDWRIRGFDRGHARMEVNLTFRRVGQRVAFVSARDGRDGPTPLWLGGRLAVVRSPRALVMAAEPDQATAVATMARRAVAAVDAVLPRWHGRLVVEVPGSQDQLNRTLGAADHDYDAIAAVTSTVDGSLARPAPTHVFVNPPVFGRLGRNGAQIVLSHEATHVATGAAVSSSPAWLLEGFADYVALADVDLPVSLSASQILGEVRKGGAPGHLPGAAEFDPANPDLGATYESAWLGCRLIATTYGEQKLIDFYRAADRASSTANAFRDVLHTSQPAFTRRWRAHLERLAGS